MPNLVKLELLSSADRLILMIILEIYAWTCFRSSKISKPPSVVETEIDHDHLDDLFRASLAGSSHSSNS